ncbi:hypothetical protein BDZ94DRAFT_1249729 [Collybia nuda]|uniref:Uncharacterized protein n=1 Tax=Collybia nuda TaxID=64659 RepID=A0A9P5YBQ0_9AGAR|nr:hypothetical protein BDZ94DRAFT_1249729 [Collybia nuda]
MSSKNIGSVLRAAGRRARPQQTTLYGLRVPSSRFSLKASRTGLVVVPPFPRNVIRPRTTLHPTSRAPLSSQSTSFADPNRPDLFYHLVDPPTPSSSSSPSFAVSFLSSPPSTSDSRTIIGWLPAQSRRSDEGAGLNDFKENSKFRDLLHKAVLDTLRDGSDEIQVNGALQLQQGWMHIHDERNVPALHRIGDPDDILASVLVQDSKIDPDTYAPMPSYRFCTADGITQLTPAVAKKLQEILMETQRAEAKLTK